MSIAVAPEVEEAQQKKAKPSRYLVKYKRRFFDINTQAFTLEASFTELAKADVRSISPTREAVDRKGINIFESSNMTIEIENLFNKWNPRNNDGVLAADAVALLGYEPQLMEFIVEMFYEVEDGTESAAIPIFTGRAVAFEFHPETDTVGVTLESKAILTKRADAENVSILNLNETLTPAPDGIITDFFTVDNGIGRVDAVRLDGVDQAIGPAVRISRLNDPENTAQATFTTPPPTLSVPKDDNIAWRKDRRISDLVGLLADEAGIGPAFRIIEDVVYPNLVLNTKIFTSQADWDAGTISQTITGFDDLETDVLAGDISLESMRLFDDFSDGNFIAPPRTWTVEGVDAAWVVSGGRLQHTGNTSNMISTPLTRAFGTWEAKIQRTPDSGTAVFFFMTDNGIFNTTTGYVLEIKASVVGTEVLLRRLDSGTATTLLSAFNSDAAQHRYRVTRKNDGTFEIFKDGVSGGTVLDLTHTTNSRIGFSGIAPSSTHTFDDIFTSPGLIPLSDLVRPSGNHITATFDTGPGNPISYGTLDRIENLPAGTILLYETAVADESTPGSGVPGAFDAFVAIAGSGQILSATKRFIQVRTTFTADGPNTLTPTLSESTINFTSLTTSIKLADFTRLTVFDAITELAKFANYEWGFQRDGKLFFRPRTPGAVPVLTIELENLKAFSRISDGVDRVFNQIRARYGAHEKFANPLLQNDPSPNSFDRFGVKVLNVGSTQILADNDADVATGLSKSYLQEFKDPRRIFELEIDMRPQLELTDTILFRILDSLPNPPWHIGDNSQAVGNQNINLFGEEQQSAFEIKGRILSLRHNVDRKITGLEVEEIL